MPNQIPPFYETPLRPNGPMPSGSMQPLPLNGSQPNGSQQRLVLDNQRLALDNLIRRELNVGDPSDPAQIARALLARYQDDPRARALDQEAQGLPFLPAARSLSPMTATPTSSDNELALAMADVEKGVTDLTTNPLLKDITPELQGWADAVRSAIQAGSTAARFAMDARQRDKAIAMRRTLGDYAHMARLVGALTPGMNPNYRAFAQSLDEAAAVILVIAGDAISSVGLNRGQFLLQAPYSELQTRRDAVIYALRNLVGATQQAFSPNDWPRGLDAYRRLYDFLERQGQGDLRSLLVETELARAMDALIQRAANGTADGLRALGATAQLDLEQMRRLVLIGRNVRHPHEPPLTSFLEGLQLFLDAFNTAGGIRLVNIARPPILFYGLYGPDFETGADRRLLRLIIERGRLADQLDRFLSFRYEKDTIRSQIILDKILYDVDRAIDLYAVGRGEFGPPELRAASYGYLIEWLLGIMPTTKSTTSGASAPPPQTFWQIASNSLRHDEIISTITAALTEILAQLQPQLPVNDQYFVRIWNAVNSPPAHDTVLQAGTTIFDLTYLYPKNHHPSEPARDFIQTMSDELCIQEDHLEDRWRVLLQSVAEDFIKAGEVLGWIKSAVGGAIQVMNGRCERDDIRIPPQFESSLQEIDRKIH
jgi:hypothetical protein